MSYYLQSAPQEQQMASRADVMRLLQHEAEGGGLTGGCMPCHACQGSGLVGGSIRGLTAKTPAYVDWGKTQKAQAQPVSKKLFEALLIEQAKQDPRYKAIKKDPKGRKDFIKFYVYEQAGLEAPRPRVRSQAQIAKFAEARAVRAEKLAQMPPSKTALLKMWRAGVKGNPACAKYTSRTAPADLSDLLGQYYRG